MEKEIRDVIVQNSKQIDELERWKGLVETANMICFTTETRPPEEMMTIEFTTEADSNNPDLNQAILSVRGKLLDYLNEKIQALNEEIDKKLEKEA